MKISIITAVYNGGKHIEDCIRSVLMQDYKDIEYIIIDGGSTDNTLEVIKKYQEQVAVLISEPDNGLYDALNKGIKKAAGDVVGILNADDMLADPTVAGKIASTFTVTGADAVYGDLNYVHPESLKAVRKWRSKQFSTNAFQLGWMPAHPTLYIKRALFSALGNYSLEFGSAADYELMLRFLYVNGRSAAYLPALMVSMRNGGQSNATFTSRTAAFRNDYKAARFHHLPLPFIAVLLKKLIKINQFF